MHVETSLLRILNCQLTTSRHLVSIHFPYQIKKKNLLRANQKKKKSSPKFPKSKSRSPLKKLILPIFSKMLMIQNKLLINQQRLVKLLKKSKKLFMKEFYRLKNNPRKKLLMTRSQTVTKILSQSDLKSKSKKVINNKSKKRTKLNKYQSKLKRNKFLLVLRLTMKKFNQAKLRLRCKINNKKKRNRITFQKKKINPWKVKMKTKRLRKLYQ